MNQNTFCSKCHRIPSQCCCGSVKELTDEEILNTWKECGESDIAKDMQVNSFLKYFARAILRKAQEK